MLLSQNHTPTRGAPSTILPSVPLEKMGPVRAGARAAGVDLTPLIERLHFDDGGAMVAADPERRPLGEAVHEYAPDIGRARQQIVHDLPRGGVEPGHLVGQHRAGPHLGAVLDGNDVVGRAPWRRQPPLLDGVGLRVEHADAVAAIFGKPQAALLVDAAATRARQRARCRPDGDLERLGVTPADAAAAELQLIEVVLAIGGHAIGPDLLTGGRLGRTRILKLAGRQIEPIVEVILLIVGPYLAVGVRIGWRPTRV